TEFPCQKLLRLRAGVSLPVAPRQARARHSPRRLRQSGAPLLGSRRITTTFLPVKGRICPPNAWTTHLPASYVRPTWRPKLIGARRLFSDQTRWAGEARVHPAGSYASAGGQPNPAHHI